MWVPQLPQRLGWDHNAHYHPWVLRQLPARPVRALDVGCGAGLLTCELSARAQHVDAVDPSAVMLARACRRSASTVNVTFVEGDVLDPGLPLSNDGYDAIVAVSSLHHMSLEPALDRLADLLQPGGVLAVVGHYRAATASDLALELVRLPANAAVGAALALRGRAGEPNGDDMPVLAPATTLAEVRAVVRKRLPGARLRRALFWRYLLTWRRR